MTAFAQLQGTYTVNAAVATGGTNFQSFTALATALNTQTVINAVTVNVVANSGPYNETFIVNNINGTSATNTVTIQGNNNTIQFSNDAINTRIVALNGTKYLSLKNLTIKSLNNTYGWGIHLSNNAMHDTIINCKIDLSSINIGQDNSSAGIVFSNSAVNLAGATAYGNNASNIYIANNEISGVTSSQSGYTYGVSINGNIVNNQIEGASNITLKNNIIKNFFKFGVVAKYTNKLIVDGNDIHRIDKAGAPLNSVQGISANDVDQVNIVNNKIHDPNTVGSSTNASFIGIQIVNFIEDNDPNNNSSAIINNAIYNNSSFGAKNAYIRVSSNNINDCYILHNSIDVSNTITNGTGEMIGIELLENAKNIYVQNNIVNMTVGNAGPKIGLKIFEVFDLKKIKNNNIYINSTQPGLQYYAQYSNNNSFYYTTYASAQAVGMEAGLLSVDPIFANVTAGNLLPSNPQMFQAGLQWINKVPKDILNNNRNISPTLGAWEMPSNLNIDAGAIAMVKPINNCQSNQDITVRVGNFTTNPINTVTVVTYINNIAQPAFVYNTTIAGNGYADITTMNYNFLPNQKYTIKFELSNVNNGTDGNLSNNIYEKQFLLGLSGNYTLNQALPATGNNYQSFSTLANDLNTFGVCGPVVVDVDPLVDINDFFYLDSIAGASSINTITVNGNQAKISYNTINEKPATILFDNTSYVKIDNLQIFSTGDSTVLGILISNGSSFDTITNNKIVVDSDGSQYYYNFNYGRQGGLSLLMDRYIGYYNNNNYDNNTIQDIYIAKNTINSAHVDSIDYQFGIFGYGNNYNFNNLEQLKNINIIDNHIHNFASYAIHLYNCSNSNIMYNNIERPATDSADNYYYYSMGIYTYVCNNVNIIGNKIHNISVDSNINYGNGFYGIYGNSHNTYSNINNSSIIANNAIYDIKHRSFQNNFNDNHLYIYLSNIANVKIYHNTIDVDSIDNINNNNFNSVFFISPASIDVSTEIKNNLIRIRKVIGVNTYYAIRLGGFTANLLNGNMQKNNVYIDPTSPGLSGWGIVGATPYNTLAAFQAAYPTLEIGSTEEDPVYYDFANNDLTPTNPLILNAGVNLQALVPLDIEKYNRPTNPTIGAWEMNPQDYNNAGVLTLNSPLGNFCSGYRSIQCKINNAGKNNINVVTVNWSVNNVLQTPLVYNATMFGSSSGNPNNSANITLGTAFIPFGFPSQIKIWTSNPNNTQDLYNQNDTLIAFVEPTNTIAVNLFGNDTTICEGYNYSLVAGNPTQLQYTYLWDNNSTASTRPIVSPGIYWVIKTDNNTNCSAHDSIEIKYNPTPVVDLGPDQGLCLEDSIILFVGNQNIQHSVLWNDNTNTAYKTVKQSGTYYVEVTNSFGCMGSDEILIEDKEIPISDGINAVYMLNATYNFSLKNPKFVDMVIWDFGDGSPVDTGKLISTCNARGFVLHTETLDAIGLGIEEIADNLNISIYPNPANDEITILTDDNVLINKLIVYNAIGQQVWNSAYNKINKSELKISLKNLPAGMYLAEISTAKGIKRMKFELIK
jgi:hypothetical protein